MLSLAVYAGEHIRKRRAFVFAPRVVLQFVQLHLIFIAPLLLKRM
jgi:hypothetical protein